MLPQCRVPFFCFAPAVFLLLGATAQSQVDIDLSGSPERELGRGELQAAVYLQLDAHPATAHREIEVRVLDEDLVRLRGVVKDESERRIAQRMASLVVRGSAIANEIRVDPDLRLKPLPAAKARTPAEAHRRFVDQLAQEVPPGILEKITIHVYPVDAARAGIAPREAPPAAAPREATKKVWIPVLEGTVPTLRHQLGLNQVLLSGATNGRGFTSPPASAVVNRTYHIPPPQRDEALRIRVPFFSLDLDVGEGGVDLGMLSPAGPMRIRTGSGYDPETDHLLLDRYHAALRNDPQLHRARLGATVVAGVLILEGELTAAEKMRAVALAMGLEGIRGIVDTTEITSGGPPYYHENDLTAYLNYRLAEHAHAWDIRHKAAGEGEQTVRATVSTQFHAALAASVLTHDPALSRLKVKPDFTEWDPARPR